MGVSAGLSKLAVRGFLAVPNIWLPLTRADCGSRACTLIVGGRAYPD
jgi:hypothetical protein